MSASSVHAFPRVRDSWSFLYVESARVERCDHALHMTTEHTGIQPRLTHMLVLLLGLGSSLTHAAAHLLAEHGCSIVWCGVVRLGCAFMGTPLRRRSQCHFLMRKRWLGLRPLDGAKSRDACFVSASTEFT